MKHHRISGRHFRSSSGRSLRRRRRRRNERSSCSRDRIVLRRRRRRWNTSRVLLNSDLAGKRTRLARWRGSGVGSRDETGNARRSDSSGRNRASCRKNRSGIEAARRAENDRRSCEQWRRSRKTTASRPRKLGFVHGRPEDVALGAL
jgi:hypothetical protein